jgi:ferredoxin
MKVRVRSEQCQGHARCVAVAPELFALDEFGNSQAVGSGTVPPGLERKARLAKANCPEFAVHVMEKGSSS